MSRQLRPMPDDFTQLALQKSRQQLIVHYRAGADTVTRWLNELSSSERPANWTGRPRIEIPADFQESAALLGNPALAEKYGCGKSTIIRWRRELGVKAPRRPLEGRDRSPPPAGFAEVARTTSVEMLCVRYRVERRRVLRWLRETGFAPKPNKLVVMQNMGKRNVAAAQVAPTNRDMSLAGRAADFLQKRGPIFRCDFIGRFKLGGTHWKWRGKAHTAAEIIAAAAERGFDPDAWKQIGEAA
ncbi:hypothetical protein [Sphingomonas sp.]|uniref:hypothetical protein n=1 Tax=Sphingomonas sp. TaxID=28214 RepID=UPI002FDAC5DC